MEGPSLRLAAEQLAPLSGKIILKVGGNSRAGIKRLENKQILSLFFSRKTACFLVRFICLKRSFHALGKLLSVYRRCEGRGGLSCQK